MWAALIEAGFSITQKVWDMITTARQAAAEKHAAIIAAFKAAESALDLAMADAHAQITAEDAQTERVIADAEKTKP